MDYLPPAISNTVGTSCIVVADVTPKALDTDDITFHVSSFEIINAPAPAAAVGGTSSLPTSGQQSAQLCTPAPAAAVGGTSSLPTSSEQSAQLKSPEDPQVCSKSLDATPTKGIIGSNDPESKEDTRTTTANKKSKKQQLASESSKKINHPKHCR